MINNENSATTDYDFKFILENGTELNLSNLKEGFYLDVYVPILDLVISKFNYSLLFTEQGYDIFIQIMYLFVKIIVNINP